MTPTDRIIAASLRDGGGTFYPDGEPWRDTTPLCRDHGNDPVCKPHAYAVAVVSFDVGGGLPLPDRIPYALAGLLPGQYLGTWRDTDGTWYVDAVRVLYSRSHAITLGRRHHQVAIYDLTAGETITL